MIEKSGVQRLSESQWEQLSRVIGWEPLSATQFVVEISKSLGEAAETAISVKDGSAPTWKLIAPSLSLVSKILEAGKEVVHAASNADLLKNLKEAAALLPKNDPHRPMLEALTALISSGGSVAAGGAAAATSAALFPVVAATLVAVMTTGGVLIYNVHKVQERLTRIDETLMRMDGKLDDILTMFKLEQTGSVKAALEEFRSGLKEDNRELARGHGQHARRALNSHRCVLKDQWDREQFWENSSPSEALHHFTYFLDVSEHELMAALISGEMEALKEAREAMEAALITKDSSVWPGADAIMRYAHRRAARGGTRHMMTFQLELPELWSQLKLVEAMRLHRLAQSSRVTRLPEEARKLGGGVDPRWLLQLLRGAVPPNYQADDMPIIVYKNLKKLR